MEQQDEETIAALLSAGFAHRSVVILTEEQTKMRHTLAQYADLFIRGDLDLHRTGLVKLTINIGSSVPI